MLDKKFFSKSFIIPSVIALAVIIAAPVIGFSVPKSYGAVENGLMSLHKRDSKYITARDTKDEAEAEKDTLAKNLSDKQKELEKFHTSQDNLEKISESNASLEEEKSSLEKEIEEKQAVLSSLEEKIKSNAGKDVTWASGDYTAGEDIAAGKYLISGNGSIAIANSGKAITNKALKEDGEIFTLRSGDRVHIDGSAKLMPQ